MTTSGDMVIATYRYPDELNASAETRPTSALVIPELDEDLYHVIAANLVSYQFTDPFLGDWRLLYSLSRVSKAWHRQILPLLFSYIELPTVSSNLLLFRTLEMRPNYASWVRGYSLQVQTKSFYPSDDDEPSLHAEKIQLWTILPQIVKSFTNLTFFRYRDTLNNYVHPTTAHFLEVLSQLSPKGDDSPFQLETLHWSTHADIIPFLMVHCQTRFKTLCISNRTKLSDASLPPLKNLTDLTTSWDNLLLLLPNRNIRKVTCIPGLFERLQLLSGIPDLTVEVEALEYFSIRLGPLAFQAICPYLHNVTKIHLKDILYDSHIDGMVTLPNLVHIALSVYGGAIGPGIHSLEREYQDKLVHHLFSRMDKLQIVDIGTNKFCSDHSKWDPNDDFYWRWTRGAGEIEVYVEVVKGSEYDKEIDYRHDEMFTDFYQREILVHDENDPSSVDEL